MEPYLLQLLGEKNHASSNTCVPKSHLWSRLLDCSYHDAIRRDACRNFLPLVQEKAEFTEHNDPGSTELEVRAEVYVFSPEEIKRIARDVDAAIGMRNDEIKRLQGRLSAPAPESAVTASQYLANLRLGGLNEAQTHIERLEKQLLAYASVCIAPPVYIMDTRFKEAEVEISRLNEELTGREAAEMRGARRELVAVKRIEELEGSVSNQKSQIKSLMATNTINCTLSAKLANAEARIVDLEFSLDGAMKASHDAKILMWKARYSKGTAKPKHQPWPTGTGQLG